MSKAIIIRDALKAGNAGYIDQLAQALPEHIKPERMVRTVLTAFAKVPKLAECTSVSVWKAVVECASLGLEPDALGRAYLIPCGQECTLVIGYKGLIDLAMRSGLVSTIHSDKVCEQDHFVYRQGSDFTLEHEPCLKDDRGQAYCYYAYCRMKDGSFAAEVMTLDEINAIRKRSKAGDNGPWKTDFDQMARKTCVKRLAKTLPLSTEFQRAIELDNDATGLRELRDVKPTPQFNLEANEEKTDVQYTDPDAANYKDPEDTIK